MGVERAWRVAGLLLFATTAMAVAADVEIRGTVRDAAGGAVPYARVTIAGGDQIPLTTSVFSDRDGNFLASVDMADPDGLDVSFFRIGWEEARRDERTAGGTRLIDVTLARTDNVAAQVPASAWIPGERGARPFHILINECAGCHQLGADRVKRFARLLHGQPLPACRAAWDAMVQFMRSQALRMGPSGQTELRWGLSEDSPEYTAATTPETSFFLPRDVDIVVPYLAEHFPTRFDELTDYDDVARLGEYGVTAATVVQEFLLPTFGWTREVSIAPGSPLVWFLELDADRLGALDPGDGSVSWFDVPGNGPQGPHTLNADADGNLWVALEESYSIGRFDPRTHAWRVYAPPSGVKFAITHDTAINARRQVQPDASGRIWLTLVGLNELWSVDVESGAIERHVMPLPPGEEPFHVFIYGAVMEPSLERVWWTQLHGFLGAFNVRTEQVERIVPFPRGAAPRRMAIEADGTLWIPLFGEGQLVKFDTRATEELARYDIPDPAAAPYSITLDEKRRAIWVATTNSDRIYRFDIDSERWRHYPLPRREAFLRMIEIDHETGDLWTAYANLPVGPRDPTVHGHAGANNIVVRLHPGD